MALRAVFVMAFAVLCSLLVASIGAVAGAEESAVPAASIAGDQGYDHEAAQEERRRLSNIKSELAFQEWAAYLSVAVAASLALIVFLFLRRHFLKLSRTAGAVSAAAVSLCLFALMVDLRFSTDGANCAAAILETGARATDYDDICRDSRESGANAFGFASLYRALFVPEEDDYKVPIDADVVTFLAYFSVPLAALGMFFAFRPLVERWFVRS